MLAIENGFGVLIFPFILAILYFSLQLAFKFERERGQDIIGIKTSLRSNGLTNDKKYSLMFFLVHKRLHFLLQFSKCMHVWMYLFPNQPHLILMGVLMCHFCLKSHTNKSLLKMGINNE